ETQCLRPLHHTAALENPGETLNLSCRGTGYTFTSSGMNWIHQPTGKPLEWIGWINTNTGAAGYAKTLEGRIELTKDNSVSMTSLKLSGLNLKSEDSAVYYCVTVVN
uniref:Ig-like domain-containing protein n=1 Tax=Oncorhynchus kisutch TaxID=8019 RepID=A0A8C7JEX9_ONCKI